MNFEESRRQRDNLNNYQHMTISEKKLYIIVVYILQNEQIRGELSKPISYKKKLLIVFCRKSRLRMIRELVFPQKFAVFGAKMVAEAENFEATIVSKLSDG